MNRTFISVPLKLLALIVGTLLLVSAGFSSLSLWRLEQEFTQFQRDKLNLGSAQFSVEKARLDNQLRIWVESFSDIVGVNERPNFDALTNAVAEQFYALQLHLNVENLWLIDENLQTLWLSPESTPRLVREHANEVLRMQEPLSTIDCQVDCQLFTSVPVINENGKIAVVTMSASLIDIIFSLHQSLNSNVAVISLPSSQTLSLQQVSFISASNQAQLKKLFAQHPEQLPLAQVMDEGIQLSQNHSHYLLNFMPLATTSTREYFLVLIDDVSDFKEKNENYRNYFLVTELFIFITLALLVFFVTSPFARRLINLANALPMLSRREFNEFRKVPLKRRSLFVDELDIVANAAQDLSFELEQLNMEVEQKTQELENIAMYDLLTGLPNRNMLNLQLHKQVASLHRSKEGIGVLFLDLDDFKKVNDSHGHGEGDRLLEEAANRIRTSINKADLACRFGGDEFVIVLPQIASVDQAVSVAQEILGRFKLPIKIGSGVFYVSTSIGIVYSDNEAIRAEDLVSFADIAMYEAKKSGGSQYHIYKPEMFTRVAQRVELEGEVRQALLKQQFSLSLQPQLSAKDKKLIGFEALLRWHHPERGMIPPDEFIPILENSEYMIELGYWVMRRCFELVSEFIEQGLIDVRVAINLSAMQFLDPHLSDYLRQLMRRFNLSAKHFELELTEQTLVSDIDTAIGVMNSLKKIGFSFAIDDFGTGYSSLAYLKKMPVDVIKIDKSFIFGMLENHSDYQIIMSTIAMVKNLGLTVVAEGVESGAQLRSLTMNDCDIIQGYYFSKPVPEVELKSFLAERLVDGYWKTQAKQH
ncbi:bifunctional diguanylate cyclase/phosphodiesterase [Thalassotalea euphylliae]|uniref:EAL domain-containing protein n=1 Tax=Thalassotalea euphylliae TaxID=1655234 RepID=A0A3E0UK17_9GAMM|nr:EAL domain-containing protein [Thalassotalea euphylliae]REL36914.1 EAL domain-containing protein [Thalassotalea euphylliae]